MTTAQDILLAFNAGLINQAYDSAMTQAHSISEAHDHDLMRFEDGSHVRVYINAEHEITIVEA